MIVCPLNYDGPSYPVVVLKHDLSEFFNDHQDEKYMAYEDYQSGNFICEMSPELELVFVLKHPIYQRYQQNVQTQC